MPSSKIITFLISTAAAWAAFSSPATAADTWRVAMVQFDGDRDFGETSANAERLLGHIEAAAANGAALVVLPEGSLHGYATATEVWCRPGLDTYLGRLCRNVAGTAETVPGGAMVAWFAAHADRMDVRIVYSTIEQDGSDYYNTVVIVGPDGYEAKYRKRVLYYLDMGYAESGNSKTIVNLPIGPVGFLICADANDDSYFTSYKHAGVSHLIIPMSWDQDPLGNRSAALFAAGKAHDHAMTLLVADAAAWDGTAAYGPSGAARVRTGLPEPGVGVEGVAYADLPKFDVMSVADFARTNR